MRFKKLTQQQYLGFLLVALSVSFTFLLTANSPFDFLSGILAGIGVGLIFKVLRFRQKK